MELNERLLAEIADVFKTVQYGRIIFYLNPDAKTLDYTVETRGKITDIPPKTLDISRKPA